MNLSEPLKKLKRFFNHETQDQEVASISTGAELDQLTNRSQIVNSQEQTTSAANDDIHVIMQYTPNPSAFKFILNKDVKTGAAATYRTPDECDNDLARSLFDIPAIEHLYFFDNVITVTLNPSVPIEELQDRIKSTIKEKIPQHDPTFKTKEDVKRADHENLPEDIKRINEILDRTIRPGLQGDGGDIEVLSYIHPELTVRYQGACGTCPSSTMGTLQALTQILRDEFDPDIEVIPV